jgi:hypothetical protein
MSLPLISSQQPTKPLYLSTSPAIGTLQRKKEKTNEIESPAADRTHVCTMLRRKYLQLEGKLKYVGSFDGSRYWSRMLLCEIFHKFETRPKFRRDPFVKKAVAVDLSTLSSIDQHPVPEGDTPKCATVFEG